MPHGRLGVGFAVLLGALAVQGAAAQDAAVSEADALAIIESAASRYSGVEALCADFTQHLLVPLLGDEHTSMGRLCQSQPNRFAMRFTDPEGDRVIIDGSFVWLYYPSLDPKQVLKLPMAQNQGGYDFHKEFLENPGQKYHVTYQAEEEVAGRRTHRLRLVPLQAKSYLAAVVWIDVDAPLLRQVRVEEENGSVRTVTLHSVEMDPPDLTDEWFTFTPPEGVFVIPG
jgi:outer membrane lipoprotein carrier protein